MSNHKKEFKKVEKKFQEAKRLVFSDILKEEEIQEILSEHQINYRDNIFTPMITLWAFLTEVLNIKESYRKITGRVKAFLISQGIKDKKVHPSTYCGAKKRLKEEIFSELVCRVGKRISVAAPQKDLWCGRKVKVYDGSSLLLPDTEKNRAAFPQSAKCRPDCGFPIVRWVVLFCLATGVVLEMSLDPMSVSEQVMYRRFFKSFEPGDVALADRGSCSYYDIALLKERGVDAVFRMNALKKVDFSKGIRLGKKDHIVTWEKSYFNKRSKALSKGDYERLPKEILVREIDVSVKRTGFRTKKMILATTLLDAEIYTREALAELYLRRWEAEINLRHLKTTMKMEMLKSKSPEMARKEVWTNLLAYNLIRRVMWEAGTLHASPPLRISFKGTLDHINAFLPQLQSASTMKKKKELLGLLLKTIAKDVIPKRENRIYKRCVKQRKNSYPFMTESRRSYRTRMLETETCA